MIEVHNSGREPYELTLIIDAGADFSHLFDVKSGRPGSVHGTVTVTADGVCICHPDPEIGRRTLLELQPDASDVDEHGWSWHVAIGPHSRHVAHVILEALTSEPTDEDLIELDGTTNADDSTLHVDDLSHHRYETWQERVPKIISSDPRLTVGVRKSLEDLASLRSSTPPPRIGGRRSRRALVHDVVRARTLPDVVHGAAVRAGARPRRAPRAGRTAGANGRCTVRRAAGKDRARTARRGGAGPFSERSRYYGTVDATPLYVLVAAEALRWGAVTTADRAWLLPAVDAAVGSIRDFGDSNGDGFVDYAPHDDRGLTNQGWKDSWDGVNFSDGSLPDAPIALVEVQGYVYAALSGAAEVYRTVDRNDDASRCDHEAHALRELFNERFWDDRGWFVEAIDGSGHPVDSLGSNPGHALWTGVADADLADRYLDAVVGDELWTGCGCPDVGGTDGRVRPAQLPQRFGVGPHDTAICLAGAARYGRWDVVDRLTDGLLDASMYFGGRLPSCSPDSRAVSSRCPFPIPARAPPRRGQRHRCCSSCGPISASTPTSLVTRSSFDPKGDWCGTSRATVS